MFGRKIVVFVWSTCCLLYFFIFLILQPHGFVLILVFRSLCLLVQDKLTRNVFSVTASKCKILPKCQVLTYYHASAVILHRPSWRFSWPLAVKGPPMERHLCSSGSGSPIDRLPLEIWLPVKVVKTPPME